MKELVNIQSSLKAPKGQYNQFGRYKYRSCEDILEAVKPLLSENKCELTISDEMIAVNDRIYVKATTLLINEKGEQVSTQAFAREEDAKKGMDASQVTGAASSYARKYALNGLFCIDDTKDCDATNTHNQAASAQQATTAPRTAPAAAPAQQAAPDISAVLAQVAQVANEEALNLIVLSSKPLYTNVQFQEAVKAKRSALKAAVAAAAAEEQKAAASRTAKKK